MGNTHGKPVVFTNEGMSPPETQQFVLNSFRNSRRGNASKETMRWSEASANHPPRV